MLPQWDQRSVDEGVCASFYARGGKKAKLKHTPKGAIARDPRPLAWGEPRLRAHPTHYLAHTPLPQRMEGGGCLLFFVCFCPEAKNSFRVIRFVDPEPLDSRISQRV